MRWPGTLLCHARVQRQETLLCSTARTECLLVLTFQDTVRKNKDGSLELGTLFGSPIVGLVIEDLENRVGASI